MNRIIATALVCLFAGSFAALVLHPKPAHHTLRILAPVTTIAFVGVS